MSEFLELFKKSYQSFYIGKDKDAWLYFGDLVQMTQLMLSDEKLDDGVKITLIDFINKFEEIETLKRSNNYVKIADLLHCFSERFGVVKEYKL